MSDPTPPKSNNTSIAIGTLLSAFVGLLGAAAGAGWPGVIALCLVGLAVPFGWNTIIKIFNDWSDLRDRDRAGSDASKTASDLSNQGREVTKGLDQSEKSDPPTDGFKPEQ